MNGYFMSVPRADLPTAQNGVALITILLIVTLLTIIVSKVGLSNQIWVRQVENASAYAQADLATRAAQSWIADILEEDKNNYDAATDVWAQPFPPVPAGWGILMGRIEDMQSRFNLNNLVDAEGKQDGLATQQFERLLQLLDLNPGIAQAVVDWIDPDGSPAGPWGAEDVYYLSLQNSYLAANRPFADPAELRLIRGVDMAAWRKLEPFVSALPGTVTLNVNTASAEVLAAAVTEWDIAGEALTLAQKWVGQASQEPVDDIKIFSEQVFADSPASALPGLGVESGYFVAHTQLNFNNVEYRTASLYRRDQGKTSLLRHKRELF